MHSRVEPNLHVIPFAIRGSIFHPDELGLLMIVSGRDKFIPALLDQGTKVPPARAVFVEKIAVF